MRIREAPSLWVTSRNNGPYFRLPNSPEYAAQITQQILKTTTIVTRFRFKTALSTFFKLALTLHSNQGFQARPQRDAIKSRANAHDSLLKTTVPFADLGGALCDHKVALDTFEQITLIPFEGTQVGPKRPKLRFSAI